MASVSLVSFKISEQENHYGFLSVRHVCVNIRLHFNGNLEHNMKASCFECRQILKHISHFLHHVVSGMSSLTDEMGKLWKMLSSSLMRQKTLFKYKEIVISILLVRFAKVKTAISHPE